MMNKYDYSDITTGMRESFQTAVTPEFMQIFADLSGDSNPLHTDESYAREHGFSGRVVYGMLAAAFYSRLAGMYLPGERCLLKQLNVKFRKPVYIGDMLTVTGEVTEKSDAFRQLVIRAETRNQAGEKVNTATITVGML